ncbi:MULTISPECIES: tryptophan-rich sensory protein [Bacillus]|uniref:tryptophan-rich sensory protein n=1 Tax=Bacillus TaxID=1386 RepID=UPI0003096380|nr:MULTISPECIES: tryptophan-rich sensory protein [Bacillus]
MFTLYLNIVTFILVLIVNFFAETIPLNDQTTGEISNKLDVILTPAGFTFSIWIVIYILVGIWVFRQIPSNRRNLRLYRATSPYFIISNLLNCAWIFLWHYEQFLASVIIMLLLLLSLIFVYQRIHKAEHDFIDLFPFSIYLGWITVATFVNIAYYVKYLGWNGFGLSMTLWSFIILIMIAVITILFRLYQNDWAYPLVISWSLIGIGVSNLQTHTFIAYFSFFLALLIVILLPFIKERKRSYWR